MFFVQRALVILVAEHFDAEFRGRRIEDAQYDFLAEQGRAGVDAKVDRAILAEPHLDAAVLRHAPLGDIHARHDLETGTDLVGQHDGRLRDLAQHAV